MEGGNPTSIPYVRTKSGVVYPFSLKASIKLFWVTYCLKNLMKDMDSL